MKYLIVLEKTTKIYSAYIPDVPGCVAKGSTPTETRKHLEEALKFHFEGLKKDGIPTTAIEGGLEMSSVKTELMALLDTLSDECTLEDVQYHFYAWYKVQRGFKSLENGQAIPQEEVEKRIKKWFDKKFRCQRS